MFFPLFWEMLRRIGIVASFIAVCALATSANAQYTDQNLTLSDAIAFTLTQNPQLHQFTIRKSGLFGQRTASNLSPGLNLGLEVENVGGSGVYSGAKAAESMLSLSSVIELGAKRDARVSVANARLSTLEYQQQAFTLDVLGELTAVFVKTLEVQELIGLAKEARDLAENTLSIVQNRSGQGAAPDSEVQRAAAALAQTELQLDALQRTHKRQIITLAAYWGEQSPTWPQLSGNLFAYSSLTTYPSLYQRALSSPAIEVFASTERLKTAELSLAKTQSTLDVNWQVGVRRVEESGDSAFMAGMSIPLFGGTRNRGNVTSALAERNEVKYQRQAALQRLHVQLFTAYSQYEQYVNAVESFQTTIIPNLSSALKATQRAYETGRYSYQDWIAAQKELLSAKQTLIESATAASLNQAAIEQLIAEPLSP